jgi:hypothetical protein
LADLAGVDHGALVKDRPASATAEAWVSFTNRLALAYSSDTLVVQRKIIGLNGMCCSFDVAKARASVHADLACNAGLPGSCASKARERRQVSAGGDEREAG